MHQLHRNSVGELVADEHGRHVGQEHPQRGSDDHPNWVGIVSRHGHGGDLRLVAHLGEEEGNQRGPEDAEALRDLRLFFLDLVGNQVQMAMPMNEAPSTQRRIAGETAEVIQAPKAPATP